MPSSPGRHSLSLINPDTPAFPIVPIPSQSPRTVAARLAHLIGLNHAPGLKLAIKNLLDTLADPFCRGLILELGGAKIRVPARFRRQPWTNYETASTTMVSQWLATRQDAVLLDVGCSVALYSLLALAASPRTNAWAFDADLTSLQSSKWLCQHVGTERLHVIYGFIADKPDVPRDAARASREITELLTRTRIPREPSLSNYVCIDGKEHPLVPTNTLDFLFPHADQFRPWLLKCDVEGAEMVVLLGADRFVRRARPQLLISVHPATLAGFGYSRKDLAHWIEERGYNQRILSIDHEEHWWCEPLPV